MRSYGARSNSPASPSPLAVTRLTVLFSGRLRRPARRVDSTMKRWAPVGSILGRGGGHHAPDHHAASLPGRVGTARVRGRRGGRLRARAEARASCSRPRHPSLGVERSGPPSVRPRAEAGSRELVADRHPEQPRLQYVSRGGRALREPERRCPEHSLGAGVQGALRGPVRGAQLRRLLDDVGADDRPRAAQPGGFQSRHQDRHHRRRDAQQHPVPGAAKARRHHHARSMPDRRRRRLLPRRRHRLQHARSRARLRSAGGHPARDRGRPGPHRRSQVGPVLGLSRRSRRQLRDQHLVQRADVQRAGAPDGVQPLVDRQASGRVRGADGRARWGAGRSRQPAADHGRTTPERSTPRSARGNTGPGEEHSSTRLRDRHTRLGTDHRDELLDGSGQVPVRARVSRLLPGALEVLQGRAQRGGDRHRVRLGPPMAGNHPGLSHGALPDRPGGQRPSPGRDRVRASRQRLADDDQPELGLRHVRRAAEAKPRLAERVLRCDDRVRDAGQLPELPRPFAHELPRVLLPHQPSEAPDPTRIFTYPQAIPPA